MGRIVFKGNKGHGSVRIGEYGTLIDGDYVQLGNKKYEFNDTEGDVTAGRVWVHRQTDAATCITNLVAAILAEPPTSADDGSAPCKAYVDTKSAIVCRIEATARGRKGNVDLIGSFADSDNTVAAEDDKLAGAEEGSEQNYQRGVYTVTAHDVAADNLEFPCGLTSPSMLMAQVYSAAGVLKACTAEFTFIDGLGDGQARVRGNFAGATDPAATDEVRWFAVE